MTLADVDARHQEQLLAAFLQQQRWCRQSSPFTARLMALSISWLECEGRPEAQEAMALLSTLAPEPLAGAVPLRWAAALHRLALQGLQPWCGLWPSTQPPGTPAASGERYHACFAQAWREQQPLLQQMLHSAPQTNEVARSAMLLPGLLLLQHAHPQHRLHLLELGSSAGLNLLPDAWCHDYGSWRWGDADSAPLTLRSEWQGALPPAHVRRSPLDIAQRQGCDLNPLPLSPAVGPQGAAPARAEAHARHLLSFVWADQAERRARLQAAIGHVRTTAGASLTLHRQPAHAFLAAQLGSPAPAGALRVVFHSIVWQYLSASEQAQLRGLITRAGAQASAERPLAWLRMEPPAPDEAVELRLTQWPGGHEQRLALCHPHGSHLRWHEISTAV
jgi:hypothetical protein